MKHWPVKPLGDFVAQRSGSVDPLKFPDEIFDLYSIPSFDEGQPEVRAGNEIGSAKQIVETNDVLLSRIVPHIRRAWVVGGNRGRRLIASGEWIVFRTPLLHPRFLRYFVVGNPFHARFMQTVSGVGGSLLRAKSSEVAKILIPVPPMPEQERIVKLLDEADQLRKLRSQADRRTTNLIPALFHEMFGDPMDNPKGWDVHPVASFVTELFGGRNVNPAGANETAGRFRVLKVSAVTRGDFRPEESKPVPAAYEPPPSHFVRPGDLLFSRANTTELVAATSFVFETPPNLLLPDKLWRFVWKEPRTVEPLFVWWLFQAASVRRELGQRATGTGGSMKNISKPKVMTLEVPVPPLPLQKEFAQRVTEIRALETKQAASRTRLDVLFESMLHRAFNDEL